MSKKSKISSKELMKAISERASSNSGRLDNDGGESENGGAGSSTSVGSAEASPSLTTVTLTPVPPVPELNHATLMGLAENLRTGNIILDIVLMTLVSALLRFFLDLLRWENFSRGLTWIQRTLASLIPHWRSKKPKKTKPLNSCTINLEFKRSHTGDIWFENNFVKNNEQYFFAMYSFLSKNAGEMRNAELSITYEGGNFRKPWDVYRNYEVGARPLTTLEVDGFFISYQEEVIKPDLPKFAPDDGKTESTQRMIREFMNSNKTDTVKKRILIESYRPTEEIIKFIDGIYQAYVDKKYPIPPEKPKARAVSPPDPRYYFCRQQGAEESYERYELHVKKTFGTLYFPRKEKLLKRLDRFARGMTTSGKFTILLHGPPGGGKTSFIKALCNYTDCHVINIKLSQFANLQQLMNVFHREYLWIPELGDRMYIPINKRIYLFEDIDCDNNKIVLKRSEDQEKQIKEYLKKQRKRERKGRSGRSAHSGHGKGKHAKAKHYNLEQQEQTGAIQGGVANPGEASAKTKIQVKIVKKDAAPEDSETEDSEFSVSRRSANKSKRTKSDNKGKKAGGNESEPAKDLQANKRKRKSKKGGDKNSGRSDKGSGSTSSDEESADVASDSFLDSLSESDDDSIAGLWSNDYSNFYGSFGRAKYNQRSSKPDNPLEAPSLSLAGILNLLDGVLELNGCYIVMTTNHKEKLDKALTRPGRVNYEQELTFMEQPDMYQMIRQYVPDYRWQLRHLGEESSKKQAMVSEIAEENQERAAAADRTGAAGSDSPADVGPDDSETEVNSTDSDNDSSEKEPLADAERDEPRPQLTPNTNSSRPEAENEVEEENSREASESKDENEGPRRVELYSPEWENQQLSEIWRLIRQKPQIFSITSRVAISKNSNPATKEQSHQTDPTSLFKSLLLDVEKLQTMPCLFETICQNEDHVLEIMKNMVENIVDRDIEREATELRMREIEEQQRQKREREKERRKAKAMRHENYAVGLSSRYGYGYRQKEYGPSVSKYRNAGWGTVPSGNDWGGWGEHN